MLSDRCLSDCLPVLSVTLVYCGQMVAWIKMKLGMQVGLGPSHILLDGDPSPPPTKGHSPQFLTHICCGQMVGWIKMPLGLEVGLGPSDYMLDGDPAPPPIKRKGHSPPLLNFRPMSGQMAVCICIQLRTEVGLSLGNIVLEWDPAPPPLKGHSPPIFRQCPLWPNGWMD